MMGISESAQRRLTGMEKTRLDKEEEGKLLNENRSTLKGLKELNKELGAEASNTLVNESFIRSLRKEGSGR